MNYEQRLKDVWKHTQRGLVYPAPHAVFVTFWLQTLMQQAALGALVNEIQNIIRTQDKLRNSNSSAVLGVSFSAWRSICEQEQQSIPKAIELSYPESGRLDQSTVFEKSNGVIKEYAPEVGLISLHQSSLSFKNNIADDPSQQQNVR